MNMRSHPCFVSLSYSIFLFFFFAFYYTMRLLTLPSPQHPQLELSEKHTRVVSKISLSATTNRRCGYQHYAYYSCILLTSQYCQFDRKEHQFFLSFYSFFPKTHIATNYVDKKKKNIGNIVFQQKLSLRTIRKRSTKENKRRND